MGADRNQEKAKGGGLMAEYTTSKKKYIEEWNEYIGILYLLAFTPDEELRREVKQTVEKLKDLMKKVADDKFGKLKKVV